MYSNTILFEMIASDVYFWKNRRVCFQRRVEANKTWFSSIAFVDVFPLQAKTCTSRTKVGLGSAMETWIDFSHPYNKRILFRLQSNLRHKRRGRYRYLFAGSTALETPQLDVCQRSYQIPLPRRSLAVVPVIRTFWNLQWWSLLSRISRQEDSSLN